MVAGLCHMEIVDKCSNVLNVSIFVSIFTYRYGVLVVPVFLVSCRPPGSFVAFSFGGWGKQMRQHRIFIWLMCD